MSDASEVIAGLVPWTMFVMPLFDKRTSSMLHWDALFSESTGVLGMFEHLVAIDFFDTGC